MKRKLIFGIITVVLLGGAFLTYTLLKQVEPEDTSNQQVVNTPRVIPPEPIAEEPTYDLVDVQSIIDSWGAQQTGDYSIVVYDLENNKTIGSHNPDEVYFAASIYKLYVAYEGYLAIANNLHELDEVYLGGWTREKCLDEMIRTSHSPCAEKLWAELGKEQTTEKLKTYGITNTSMTGITTSAADAATLLQRLHNQEELPKDLTLKMLGSMKEQIYRDALAKGFEGGEFYDKVGFRELDEYHDVGILSLPNGRNYVVSMLTSNIGTRAMVDLAEQLYAKLNIPS